MCKLAKTVDVIVFLGLVCFKAGFFVAVHEHFTSTYVPNSAHVLHVYFCPGLEYLEPKRRSSCSIGGYFL